MGSSTGTDRDADRRGALGTIARTAAFALYCVVVVEALLWVASATIPQVGDRLSGGRTAPRYLSHPTLGKVGNPAWVDHDARGFRNEVVLDEASIVALGDSQTWGVNAPRERAWPKRLQALLGIPVYNMAVGASGPLYYHHLVEEALSLSPEWILTGFYLGNDVWNAENDYYLRDLVDLEPAVRRVPGRSREVAERAREVARESRKAARLLEFRSSRREEAEAGGIPGSGWVDLLREHAKLWKAARAIKQGLRSRLDTETTESGAEFSRRHWDQLVERAERDPGVVVYESDRTRTILHPGHRIRGVDLGNDPLIEEGLRISLEVLRRIDRRAGEGGARQLVVLIPSKEYVYAPSVEDAGPVLSRLVEGEDEIRARSRRFFEEEDMEYVDTAPALRAAVERGVQVYPYSTQSHPNENGYAVIAEAVAEGLRAHGL